MVERAVLRDVVWYFYCCRIFHEEMKIEPKKKSRKVGFYTNGVFITF